MLSFFKSIVWTSAASSPAAKPLAASVWRSERIARFKEGIETLRRQAEEEEDYRGCGVPVQKPRGPRVIYDPAIHGTACP